MFHPPFYIKSTVVVSGIVTEFIMYMALSGLAEERLPNSHLDKTTWEERCSQNCKRVG